MGRMSDLHIEMQENGMLDDDDYDDQPRVPTKIYRYKNYNEIDDLTRETIITSSGVNNIEELTLDEINSYFNGYEVFINQQRK
jgi:hypothetical protein